MLVGGMIENGPLNRRNAWRGDGGFGQERDRGRDDVFVQQICRAHAHGFSSAFFARVVTLNPGPSLRIGEESFR